MAIIATIASGYPIRQHNSRLCYHSLEFLNDIIILLIITSLKFMWQAFISSFTGGITHESLTTGALGSWVRYTGQMNISYLIPLKSCIGVRLGRHAKTIDVASDPDWLFRFVPVPGSWEME